MHLRQLLLLVLPLVALLQRVHCVKGCKHQLHYNGCRLQASNSSSTVWVRPQLTHAVEDGQHVNCHCKCVPAPFA
jgi:hypothetical protein